MINTEKGGGLRYWQGVPCRPLSAQNWVFCAVQGLLGEARLSVSLI